MRRIVDYLFEVEGNDGGIYSTLHCVCEDKSVWYLRNKWNETEKKYIKFWEPLELPEIPQDKEKDENENPDTFNPTV